MTIVRRKNIFFSSWIPLKFNLSFEIFMKILLRSLPLKRHTNWRNSAFWKFFPDDSRLFFFTRLRRFVKKGRDHFQRFSAFLFFFIISTDSSVLVHRSVYIQQLIEFYGNDAAACWSLAMPIRNTTSDQKWGTDLWLVKHKLTGQLI